MLAILALTVPIYAAIAAGYLATRFGMFTPDDMRVFSTFVINFAVPCLLFMSIATRPFSEIANSTYLAAYALGTLAVIGFGLLYARKLERLPAVPSAFRAMGMSAPNSAFVGFPVLMVALPQSAGVVLGLNMLVENLVTIPLILLLAERGRGDKVGFAREALETLRRLGRNPMIGAIVAGVAFSLLRLPVPEVVATTVDLFGRASTSIALFSIGGMLVGLSLHGMIRQVVVLTLGKLVLQPLAVTAAMWALVTLGMPALNRELGMALVISSAMPVMATYAVLAHQYGDERVPPAVLLATTALSFVTLSGLLVLFRVGV